MPLVRFMNLLKMQDVRFIGCEAAGHGVDTDKTAATMATGTVRYFPWNEVLFLPG